LPPQDESLPLDEKCTHGTLDNGMTYYVQSNKMPEERAELRLVVKIGSVYEAENEVGLACLPAPTRAAFLWNHPPEPFSWCLCLSMISAKKTQHPQTTPSKKT